MSMPKLHSATIEATSRESLKDAVTEFKKCHIVTKEFSAETSRELDGEHYSVYLMTLLHKGKKKVLNG